MNDSSRDSFPTVWLCDTRAQCFESAPDWLTGEEASRFDCLSGQSRREFIGSRWLIRHALCSASGRPLADCKPITGRPTRSAIPTGWHLSVSHSHGLTGCALSSQPGLGLDLEPARRSTNWQPVVRRWFAESEQDWLLRADDVDQFLTVWTLKEAWLKATGRGIANHLQTLDVGAGFALTGDISNGWASVGRVEDYLVSVVSLKQTSQPYARLLTPSDDELAESGREVGQVDWFLERPIRLRAPSETKQAQQGKDYP